MEIKYSLDIYDAYLEGIKRIEPQWYSYCADEEELRDEIREEIWGNADTGNITLNEFEIMFKIPDEFIKEWKELKRLKDQE